MQLHIQKLRWQNFLAYVWNTLQTYNNLTFGYSNLQPSSFDVTFVHIPPWPSPRAHGRRCGANPMRRPPGLWTQRCQPRCGRPLRRWRVVPTGRFRGSWTLWRNMGCNWRSLTQKVHRELVESEFFFAQGKKRGDEKKRSRKSRKSSRSNFFSLLQNTVR